MMTQEIAELLDAEASRINNVIFIAEDPVQFPRRFSDQRDIEIAALLSAVIAWGRRTMICRNAEKILGLMDNQPFAYMMDKGYDELPDSLNLHRTFFASHFKWLLRGLREIYRQHDTLDAFSASVKSGKDEFPAWHLVGEMEKVIYAANDGRKCVQALPGNLDTTALKRINMALRWLVRDDGIVDMGLWKSIDKSKLYIPLDIHVGNTARELGLLQRKANDRKSVIELTRSLAELKPEDPVYYDYALFGIGVSGNQLACQFGSHGS